MGIESATYISDLNEAWPLGSDLKSTLDNHHRLTKAAIKTTFPNVTGAVTPTHTELNYVDGVTSAIQTQLDAKAPAASPTFTGTVTLPATGSGATEAVRKDYADALAFNAALPTQAGNTDKITTTNGTAASWTANLKSTVIRWVDGTDTTKILVFALSGFTTATTRTVTWPDKNGTVAMTSDIPAASPVGLVCLAVASASSSATIDFTSVIDSTYDEYVWEFINVVPASNSDLWLRTSTDNGSSFAASAGNYGYAGVKTSTGTSPANHTSSSATQILLAPAGVSTTAAHGGISGTVRLFAPSGTASNKQVTFQIGMYDGTDQWTLSGSGQRLATAAVNAVRFMMSTGNITSGLFKLYGVRKSV